RRRSWSLAPRRGRRLTGTEPLPQLAHPAVRLLAVRGKAARLPDLKLEALADEGDEVRQPRPLADSVGKDRPPVLVDRKDLALADERRREELVVLRERVELRQALLDRFAQPVAARVHRPLVERRTAIEALEAVPRQHRAERRRNGDAPLPVDPVGEG